MPDETLGRGVESATLPSDHVVLCGGCHREFTLTVGNQLVVCPRCGTAHHPEPGSAAHQ